MIEDKLSRERLLGVSPLSSTPLKVGHNWKSLFGLPQPSADPLRVTLQARGEGLTKPAPPGNAIFCYDGVHRFIAAVPAISLLLLLLPFSSAVNAATRTIGKSRLYASKRQQHCIITTILVGSLLAGHNPSWIAFGPTGRGQEGEHMEFGAEEASSHMQITVQAGRRFVAEGVVAVQELWQVSDIDCKHCKKESTICFISAANTHDADSMQCSKAVCTTVTPCNCLPEDLPQMPSLGMHLPATVRLNS